MSLFFRLFGAVLLIYWMLVAVALALAGFRGRTEYWILHEATQMSWFVLAITITAAYTILHLEWLSFSRERKGDRPL